MRYMLIVVALFAIQATPVSAQNADVTVAVAEVPETPTVVVTEQEAEVLPTEEIAAEAENPGIDHAEEFFDKVQGALGVTMTEELNPVAVAQVPLHLVRQLPIEGERINVAWSKNGSLAAVSTKEIKAFDPNGKELFRLAAWTGSPHGAIAWSPNGEWIGVGTANGVFQIIDNEKGRIAYGCRLGHVYDCLNISWFGHLVCASVVTGEAVIVDTTNWEEVARFKQSLSPRVLDLKIKDGKIEEMLLEAISDNYFYQDDRKNLLVGGHIHDFVKDTGVSLAWENRSLGLVVRKGNQIIGRCPSRGIESRVSRNGRYVAQWWTSDKHGAVVHDTKTGQRILATEQDVSGLNTDMAFSPDEKFVAIGSTTLKVWALPND